MMLINGKLIALLYCAALTNCIRCFTSQPHTQPSTIESDAVYTERNVVKVPRHDYVAEMNLVSDVILCTVGLLEFLIRAHVLKPCWLGCGNKVRYSVNTIDSTVYHSQTDSPSYAAVLSNMSLVIQFPHEVLDILQYPEVQELVASSTSSPRSGTSDNSSREAYVKIENATVTLGFDHYIGLDEKSATSYEKDDSFSSLELVDITPLFKLMDSILRDTEGVCSYLHAWNSDQDTTHGVRIPEAVYAKAQELHTKLHVFQYQDRRTILLDGAMVNADTLVSSVRKLVASLTTCLREDI
ncbi:hypothetical protein V1517DRAFT_325059 [Lipomyces orientalis]|uniref:Uncharacterized protein n=1 Tax=Lipomyces orientalis TaxID=1233043 RepID=A0ACC3TM18_9ASCO